MLTQPITLLASFYKMGVDKEGEGTVSFKIPLSDVNKLAHMVSLTNQTPLEITIKALSKSAIDSFSTKKSITEGDGSEEQI